MVLPMPGDALLERLPVPAVIREVYWLWWWILITFLIVLFTLQIFAQYLFNAIYTGTLAYCIWFCIRDSFKDMSAMCLQIVGFVCLTCCIFDTALLCTMITGRREQSTERTHFDPAKGESTFKVKITTRPFFDESAGPVYNVQSLCRLLSPIIFLIAVVLCYKSYEAYEQDFLAQYGMDPNEAAHLEARGEGGQNIPPGGYGALGPPGVGGRRQGGGRGGGGPAAGRPGGGSFSPFGGQGQRLGEQNT
mmetsp:Transcript_4615/g.13112  ORF Transcript_4615/g.13112 Transcript_4615/m.13112 type:complete len:248 (-) Transcript_4615:17-760(-)